MALDLEAKEVTLIQTPVIRLYLLVSATLLLMVALGYGVAPGFVLPYVLGISINTPNLTNAQNLTPVFRAMMGLYLGTASLWFAGVWRPQLTRPAIISEIFFMSGLGLGRLLSVIVDGWPRPLLSVGMLLELLLALWGVALLKGPMEAKPPEGLSSGESDSTPGVDARFRKGK